MDFAVEKCIDDNGNQRCSKPFLVSKATCYNIEWSTDGVLSHTTVEVKDAGSNEIVYYRDTNGDWTPEKNEVCYAPCFSIYNLDTAHNTNVTCFQLVYVDFKPKIWNTGNDTVDYKITTCK
jgi:hypothetical protein